MIDLLKLSQDIKNNFDGSDNIDQEDFDENGILKPDACIQGNANLKFKKVIEICELVGQENVTFDYDTIYIDYAKAKEIKGTRGIPLPSADEIYLGADGKISFWFD